MVVKPATSIASFTTLSIVAIRYLFIISYLEIKFEKAFVANGCQYLVSFLVDILLIYWYNVANCSSCMLIKLYPLINFVF